MFRAQINRVDDGRLIRVRLEEDDGDLCGFCGERGTDSIPRKLEYEGQQLPGTLSVHADCEEKERERAGRALLDRAGREGGMLRYYGVDFYIADGARQGLTAFPEQGDPAVPQY